MINMEMSTDIGQMARRMDGSVSFKILSFPPPPIVSNSGSWRAGYQQSQGERLGIRQTSRPLVTGEK